VFKANGVSMDSDDKKMVEARIELNHIYDLKKAEAFKRMELT
jgi:hypothetical protein